MNLAMPTALADAVRRPAAQQPEWGDTSLLTSVDAFLTQVPPLVTAAEVSALTTDLAAVARGEAFLLQGGDCAETFAEGTPEHVHGTVRTLLRMAGVIAERSGLDVVPVGRIAGQYAKPRSQDRDALGLPVYRGDIVNAPQPDIAARTPDPARMVRAYLASRTTLTEVRAIAGHEVRTSHEALLLDYERPLVRVGEFGGRHRLYAGSAHFLWIGERTRQLDGAHVEFARLVANPIGVKLGPGTTPAQAAEYVERLDPRCEPGRLTLITRLGAGRVHDVLPAIVARVTATGHEVVWQCDPMHGNTFESRAGYKTRHLSDIGKEVADFIAVHREMGTHPGGLHLELTGDPVTECLDDTTGDIRDDHGLTARYATTCDPRLNLAQATALAEQVAELLGAGAGDQ
ncbi:3-deoxy-7-phosphoheptulonate synthase [Actinophytocola sp.]|uniref:3-deoxy-7-phosphoheptulonate synthase n=1 Tax=Actinophytocola sp. TaxID=1872138 RepID=UPI002D36B8A4|nr:3-deoxy-7-phosphoheptulonate synthase [Actinophytocola sp.]HYQ68103.1 3-deoxy-7-phosphoheptulonate synthase [Actinophytocola sp.]